MGAKRAGQSWRNSAAWRKYKEAFEDFRGKARLVQNFSGTSVPDRASLDTALTEMEIAREYCQICRNALLEEMGQDVAASDTGLRSPREGAVREMAALLWELEGRRDGRALEDWYRAEEILHCSALHR